MPNWKTHLEIGNRLNKYLKFDNKKLNEFLLGSILPDFNNRYIVKNISSQIGHTITHFKTNDKTTYNNFMNKYKDELVQLNPVFLGYFIHLFIDYFWNNNYYTNIAGHEIEGKSPDERREIKQHDFKVYNNYFMDDIITIDDKESLLNEIKKISEVSVTEEDVVSVENFLNQKIIYKGDYIFYSKEQLDNLMDESVNMALEQIKKIKEDLI